MADARRKTSLEERKEIVAHSIARNKAYKGRAALYPIPENKHIKKYKAKFAA